jgi:hypothetical protein
MAKHRRERPRQKMRQKNRRLCIFLFLSSQARLARSPALERTKATKSTGSKSHERASGL